MNQYHQSGIAYHIQQTRHKLTQFCPCPSHDLHDGAPLVGLHSVAQLVDTLNSGIGSSVEANTVVGAADVIVDGTGNADDINAVFAEGSGTPECSVTAKGYKYFLYYSAQPKDGGHKQMGVAVADAPTGPFVDLGHPLISKEPEGFHGQLIDVDVFVDPVSKKPYLYWGNGMMAGAELNADMTSIKEETITLMTPKGGSLRDYAYREAPYVFYRNGLYYFMWSVDDTGSPNYHVAYGTSTSPLGPIKVADKPVVLQQDAQREIYGTAHNSVIQVPGTDEWYIVYHRINKDWLRHQPGVHRETCIDRLYFNADGTIKPVVPTE